MDAELLALVERADEFHFSDRKIRTEHERIARSLQAGSSTGAQAEHYRRTLETYFKNFEKETRAQVRQLDRRLAELAQLQLNFTAERNVAVRRLENIAALLGLLGEHRT